MDLELIETEEALRRLEPEWNHLWRQDPAAEIFTSFDWFLNWWEHFGRGTGADALVVHDDGRPIGIRGRGARLQILCIRDKGRPIAIAPLILLRGWWRRCPVRIMAAPVNNHAPRSGFLVPFSPEVSLSMMSDYLANSTAWDILLLDGMPLRSGIVTSFGQEAHHRGLRKFGGPPMPNSYLALDGSWSDYLQRRSGTFRRSLHRTERALERLGKVGLTCYEDPSSVETGIKEFMEIDGESWKARGGESLSRHPKLGAYYGALVRRFARRNRCQVWVLKIGEEPASAFICLHDNRVLYTMKTSYKERFASNECSPGLALMARILQRVWQTGFVGVDFVGRTSFSERWASGTHDLGGLILYQKRFFPRLLGLLESLRRDTHTERPVLPAHLEKVGGHETGASVACSEGVQAGGNTRRRGG